MHKQQSCIVCCKHFPIKQSSNMFKQSQCTGWLQGSNAQAEPIGALQVTSPVSVPTFSPASANTPFVQFQAVYLRIPQSSLTPDGARSTASSLSSAIASWVSPENVTVNITPSLGSASSTGSSATATAAASSSTAETSGRRQLLQSTRTFQATVTFTLTFASQSAASRSRSTLNTDLSAAITQAVSPLTAVTTLTPFTSGTNYALNASVTFPPDNTVSATPSQGTLAAVTLATALEANAGGRLQGLVAKDGPITVTGVSLQDVLIPAGPASTLHVPPPPPGSSLPSSVNISNAVGGDCSAGMCNHHDQPLANLVHCT